MEINKVNPVLIKAANVLISHFLIPAVEYGKENLNLDGSYVFAPNHTADLDVYLIWSLLSPYFDLNIFMKREFWDHFPCLSKLMSMLNIYPISRDKINLQEISDEVGRLRGLDRSLVIFPQGRHVDPVVMSNLPEYHLNTLPKGAFYISAQVDKFLVPVFIEPPKLFNKNVVVYGKPISAADFAITEEEVNSKVINIATKKKILEFAKYWLLAENELYKQASDLAGRDMRSYSMESKYWTAKGALLCDEDPNMVKRCIPEIVRLTCLSNETGIVDLDLLLEKSGMSNMISDEIKRVSGVYQRYLIRKN